ncbi:hypothetical protein Tco_0186280 [Tanacetum coccineum]
MHRSFDQTENRSKPYKLEWLKKGDDVIVSKRVLVAFSLGATYKDSTYPRQYLLLSQELLKGYDRKDGRNRVAMEIDIQKPYDTSFGYFKSGRRLRQGDPMSSYLFTLVMEMLSIIVQDKVEKRKEFKYHFGCKKMKLTRVCFAHDLLMFWNGDKGSVSVLKEAIEEFGSISGLLPNYNESTIIF